MMRNNQNGFRTVFAFAMVTLLSCCFSPVSSFFALPRVSRTNDAIIIDYEGVGYSPFSLGRGYGQFVDPGFIPLPAFNPYGMFYGGWPHFGKQAPATCGKGPAPPTRSAISERIVGTTTPVAASKPWPFLVVLRKSSDAADTFFCSGSLISETKVLLAAQCLEKLSVYEISSVTVLVGLLSVKGATIGFPSLAPNQPGIPGAPASSVALMTRRISKVVIHSGYNAATYANDIAIITLDMPIVISNKVGPVCLPPASTDPDQYVDKDGAVMGWYKPPATGGSNDPAPDTAFKQGKVTIGSVADCKGDTTYGKYFTDANICIATDSPAVTCPTEIGGPVVVNTAPATAGAAPVWTVVGINSYTPNDACGGSTFKNGLKTRVSAYSAWITTYMA